MTTNFRSGTLEIEGDWLVPDQLTLRGAGKDQIEQRVVVGVQRCGGDPYVTQAKAIKRVAVVAAVEQQLAPRQHAAEIGGATKGAVDGRQRRRRRGVFEERSEQPEAHLAVGTTPQESAEALPLFAVMPELAVVNEGE